jgi:hypothetical protein
MYGKHRNNKEPVYFIYAPPQTRLDPRNARLPALARPGHNKFHNSVYYYWWAFIRLNTEYMDCCQSGGQGPLAEIYADFGDVRDQARPTVDGDAFKAWWIERGADLFAEPVPLDQAETLEKLPDFFDFKHNALISIPLNADFELTMKEIRLQLKAEFDGYRRHFPSQSRAKYPVKQRPVLSALDDALRCKLAQIQNPEMDQYALADAAGLEFPQYSARDGDDIYALKTRTVSRALQRANALIANVIKGDFPSYNE